MENVCRYVECSKSIRMSEEKEDKKVGKPRGMGIGTGIAIGAGIGIAMDNLAIGIGVGIAMGFGFELINRQRNKTD